MMGSLFLMFSCFLFIVLWLRAKCNATLHQAKWNLLEAKHDATSETLDMTQAYFTEEQWDNILNFYERRKREIEIERFGYPVED